MELAAQQQQPQSLPPPPRHRPRVPWNRRKRVSLACVQCRKDKKRCQAGQGLKCANCERTRSACVFEASRRSPKDHHSSLASVASPIGVDVDGSSNLSRRLLPLDTLERRFRELHPDVGLRSHHIASLVRLLESEIHRDRISSEIQSERRLDVARVSTRPSHEETWARTAQIDGEPHESTSEHPQSTHNIPQSLGTFISKFAETVSYEGDADVLGGVPPFQVPHKKNLTDDDEEGESLLHEILEQFPHEEEADYLVTTFFIYCGTNFFFFEEKWFRQVLRILMTDCGTGKPDATLVCLALLVLALGRSFTHLSQAPCNSSSWVHKVDTIGMPGAHYFKLAQKLMPQVLATVTLHSLQVCHLTGIYIGPTNDIEMCYTYLGLAIRIAVALSLHWEKNPSELCSRNDEINRRIFWSTYCMERQIVFCLGYPEMLREEDIRLPLPQLRADLDHDLTRFEHLLLFIELSLLQGKIIRKRLHQGDCSTIAEVRAQLDPWQTKLYAHRLQVKAEGFRQAIHLEIAARQIWIYEGRTTLLEAVGLQLDNRKRGSKHDLQLTEFQAELISACITASQGTIDRISLLLQRGLLSPFSFTDHHFAIFATVILLLATLILPSPSLSASIGSGMEALEYLAVQPGRGRNNLRLITQFQKAINELSHLGRTASQDQNIVSSPLQPDPNTTTSLDKAPQDVPEVTMKSPPPDYQDQESESAQMYGDFELSPSDFETIDPEVFRDLESMTADFTAQELTWLGLGNLEILGDFHSF